MNVENAKNQIVNVAKTLWQRNLNGGYGGNMSIRLRENLIITPTGKPKHLTTPDELAIINIKTGKFLSGKPSSEYKMHLQIYRALPEVKAILHAHPPFLMGYSLAQISPPTDSFPETSMLVGKVPVVPPYPSGSWKLANAVAYALKQYGARMVILANHGVTITSEKDLWDAYFVLEAVEHVAIAGIVDKLLRGGVK